ncbi:EAL domain-containing protein [Bacillus sp. EB106-08-02-XG196]|uniref:EAL domain-containing protein n=1 Tax=Bacillus sp. EB106-08-02-XG196 TaxID=2737049 RepID=UPI0015C4AC56|nr:EAL domain-containing protein [Bacillus sp. EB106-08-02-XG196]NWQ44415.1 EAL domain-containing protein [Bacillus sp. EB106-08-02-XG196]
MFSNGKIVGVYGIAKDITELKLTEARLKENEVQFHHIFNSLDVGVWSWDIRQHKLLYVSKAIETISGMNPLDFKKGFRNWKELIHPEDRAEFKMNQIELRNGIPCQYQYRIMDVMGNVKWIDARTFPVLNSEGELVRLDGLITDISKKKLEDEKINFYAYHDYLTGLPNRRKFEEELEKTIINKKEKAEKFALLYLDLDRFKFVNDTLGHSVGDELLKKVSNRLSKRLRPHDHLARLGGDEFAIILNQLGDANETITIASSIIIDIERYFKVNEYDLHITTSIGIGIYPQDGQTVSELLANTDVALYRAKVMGKNNSQLYSPSMNIESYKQFVLENDLRSAVFDKEFILHYQPKVDPKTRQTIGAEALIRWNHPEWGMLSPAEFIPLAEETNIIFELGDWVLSTVCKQINQWKIEGKPIVPVSINISAKRFLKDDLVTKLVKILDETNVETKWLEFEITETSIIQNEEKSLAMINLLKEIGITISLDDFGTGYSSISYLKKFKVDFLKIDRSFINGIQSCSDDEAIVKSILHLAHDLNMKVVAEGVETEEQLAFLLQHQCDVIQGFLFSKPLEAEGFMELLSNDHMQIIRNIEKHNKVPEKMETYRIDIPKPIKAKMVITQIDGVPILLGDTCVVIENIGIGGLRFSTKLQLPVLKNLKLTIETNAFHQPLSVEGRILWKDELNANRYQYSLEFDLDEGEKALLTTEISELKV